MKCSSLYVHYRLKTLGLSLCFALRTSSRSVRGNRVTAGAVGNRDAETGAGRDGDAAVHPRNLRRRKGVRIPKPLANGFDSGSRFIFKRLSLVVNALSWANVNGVSCSGVSPSVYPNSRRGNRAGTLVQPKPSAEPSQLFAPRGPGSNSVMSGLAVAPWMPNPHNGVQ